MIKPISISLAALALVACASTNTVTTTAPEPVQEFVNESTVDVGDRYSYTMSVTCGEVFQANGDWWVVSEYHFEHPNYPAGWPVEILYQSPVDGPDARIEGVLEVVASDTIEFNLADEPRWLVLARRTDLLRLRIIPRKTASLIGAGFTQEWKDGVFRAGSIHDTSGFLLTVGSIDVKDDDEQGTWFLTSGRRHGCGRRCLSSTSWRRGGLVRAHPQSVDGDMATSRVIGLAPVGATPE